jgi:hypothetical protein
VQAKKKNLLLLLFEDSASLVLDYGDFYATADLSCTHPEKARDFWIIAKKEKIYVDYFNQKIIRYPIDVTYDEVKREESFIEDIIPNEPLKDELKFFIDLVDKREIDPEINIGKEDYYTTMISELCLLSAKQNKQMVVR